MIFIVLTKCHAESDPIIFDPDLRRPIMKLRDSNRNLGTLWIVDDGIDEQIADSARHQLRIASYPNAVWIRVHRE